MAERPGFEPGLTGPEPVVLPLDDPSIKLKPIYTFTQKTCQEKIMIKYSKQTCPKYFQCLSFSNVRLSQFV